MTISQRSTNGHVKGVAEYGEEHRYVARPTARRRRATLSRLLLPALFGVAAIVAVRILQRAGEL